MQFRCPNIELIDCHARRAIILESEPGDFRAYWRFWWNRSSGARVSYNNESLSLDPNRIIAVAPYTTVKRESDHPVDHFWLHAALSWPCERVRPQLLTCELNATEQQSMQSLWKTISSLPKASLLPRNLSILLQHWAARVLNEVDEEDWLGATQDNRIRKTLQAMDSNLEATWSHDKLAKIASLSSSAFAHLFRDEVGETPCSWLTRRRLERACIILHHSNDSIEQVASACGFANRYYFSRLFSRAFGIGPATWRKQRDVDHR